MEMFTSTETKVIIPGKIHFKNEINRKIFFSVKMETK